MTDAIANLGFVQSRLLRHSSEQPESAVPPTDAPGARFVLLAGGRPVLTGGSAVLAREALPPLEVRHQVYLGTLDGQPVFALAAEADPAVETDPLRCVDLRALAVEGSVAADELGLLATARSMLDWHARHGFCSNCGTPTVSEAGGFRRSCPQCGAHHFPRTDPVVIMLVRRGGRCLLGRGVHFKPGFYSCLAGFLEPGETIEAAVAREVHEETRVRVGAVAYHASQPWPFPASLMIGCIADGLDEAIVTDPAELADARWFDRAAVARMLEGTHPDELHAPPPMAIAHALMRAFVEERA